MAIILFIITVLICFASIKSHECTPSTWYQQNGLFCLCNQHGIWIDRRCNLQQCRPGEIKYLNGNKCMCQNGFLSCTDKSETQRDLETKIGVICVPSTTYYYDCNVCVCPSSGRTSEAQCVTDKSCLNKKIGLDSRFVYFQSKLCVPNSIIEYECLSCQCTEDGHFVPQTCYDSCNIPIRRMLTEKCSPSSYFQKQCGICFCPSNGEVRDDLCTQTDCNSINKTLHSFKNQEKCDPLAYTEPKCVYCNYDHTGINSSSCLERECLKIENMESISKNVKVGQIIPFCYQCFCPENGHINETYCTTDCSHKTRRVMFEKFLKDRTKSNDDGTLPKSSSRKCRPNSLYEDQNWLCLCPNTGVTNNGLCLPFKEQVERSDSTNSTTEVHADTQCEPNTFVTNDCNICYCNRKGQLDPKWCTYDDCQTKKTVQESHKMYGNNEKIAPECKENCNTTESPVPLIQNVTEIKMELITCEPGNLTKVGCNLCICPKTGLEKDRVCTNNNCTAQSAEDSKIHCEPLAYYNVDCNVCFCPKEGIKNIAKCTKNICEKSYLRSSSCTPGELFSDSCNICICPESGDKDGRICTDHDCRANVARSMYQTKDSKTAKYALDICFPGEEFVVGCDLCICPEMGLKAYATCTNMFCDENDNNQEPGDTNDIGPLKRIRRDADEACITYNATNSAERTYCTAGSMYIIRCRQCFCPYLGNINRFCRPLPKNFFCEEAYPNFNYLPMGRRGRNGTITIKPEAQLVKITHNHTVHHCDENGMISDECYICECQNNTVIEEHCFKRDSDSCSTAVPTFLKAENKNT